MTRRVTAASLLVPAMSVILVAGGSLHALPARAATTITVCSTGCDHTGIQPALDAAVSGDIVSVSAGTYAGGVKIDTPGVTLQGAGMDETIILSNTAYSSTNRGIEILSVGNLTIRDLTVDGGPGATFHDGIWWEGSSASSSDGTTIERVAVRNVDRRGISVFASAPQVLTNTTLRDVVVDNVTGANSGISAGGLAIVFNSAGSIENATVTRAKTGITGTPAAGAAHPVTVTGSSISDFTGIGATFFNLGISFNVTPATAPVFTISNNIVRANVERNSGIYLVAPGDGSVISNNLLVLEGDLGYGIETGWNPNATLTIERNTIVSNTGALGILATGSGGAAAPLIVRDNILRNISDLGPQTTDLRNWGINTGREAGIVISSDEHTSRTGDAFGSTVANVVGNDVGGYTHALAFVSNDTSPTTRILTAVASDNALRSTGTSAVHVLAQGTAATPVSQVPVAGNAANYAPVDVRGNYWNTNAPQFGSLLSGWFTSGNPVTSPPLVVPDSDALDQLINDLGIDPEGGLALFTPSSPGNPLINFDSSLPLEGILDWTFDDERVDLFVFSTPEFVDTFAVVDGAVDLNVDLSELASGDHRLVFVGSNSGAIVIVPVSVAAAVLAATGGGAQESALSMGLASLLLFVVGTSFIVRRRFSA